MLMSPGLALFLYGISSIPGEGTFFSVKVGVPATIGVLMMLAFVLYSFRPKHPLLDLRLFVNRNFTVATITMFLFAASFFGALFLADSQPSGASPRSTPAGSWRHKGSVRWSPCPSPARSRTGSPWAASSRSGCCSSWAACSH